MGRMITYQMIAEKGACEDYRDLFEELFPNGVEVTEAVCEQYGHQFDLWWAGNNLFSSSGREEYVQAYENGLKERVRIVNTAWERYRHEGIITATEYRKICDDSYEAWVKSNSRAFARIYNSES